MIEFVAALVVLQTFRVEQPGGSGRERERWALRVIGMTFFSSPLTSWSRLFTR